MSTPTALQNAVAQPAGEPAARQIPIGAELLPNGGVNFRVWARQPHSLVVVLESNDGGASEHALESERNGYFSATVLEAHEGSRYRFRLDDKEQLFPDPASRFQPEGPFGPSQVVDCQRFRWTDTEWPGIQLKGQVIYELHVGTFTAEGTWRAAEQQLAELAALGLTTLGVMPIADYSGRFNWGYDGVHLFAPTCNYGEPDDVRRFIDSAHRHGLGVILDVVYNHLGSIGCYHNQFSPDYISQEHSSEWGGALNFDGRNAAGVREYVVENAKYWIRDFHFDGLRIDATQAIYDNSPRHILCDITESARQSADHRSIVIIGESEPQLARLARPIAGGGHGLDALWNDDFHHSARVRLTSHKEAYFTDYAGAPEEFIAALKWGYLFQGQRYSWQKNARGTPVLDLPAMAFVNYLQNHDQVANTGFGKRVHQITSPGRLRAMTALFLLAPNTPMLMQGQEFASSSPFLYFADNDGRQAEIIAEGRSEFLSQFPSLAGTAAQKALPAPHDSENFRRCKLDFTDRERHAGVYQLHRDLLKMRRDEIAFSQQDANQIHGVAFSRDAFFLRYLADDNNDRLLLINFGVDLDLAILPQPLLAPPAGCRWSVRWSSEAIIYDGGGETPLECHDCWRLPGESALVLEPISKDANHA